MGGARLVNPVIAEIWSGAGPERGWAEALRGFDRGGAECLKSEGPASVHRATLCGRRVIVKCWEWRSVSDRLKLLFGASRARRQWRGAERLERAGVPAARPLVLARDHRPGLHAECLVLEEVEGRTLIDVMDRPGMGVAEQHRLAEAVGAQVGEIVGAGVYNRDHKPSNLIVSAGGDGPRLTVLDTVAIRRCPPGSVRRAAQMLASLHIEPTGLECAARGAPRARAVRATAGVILAKAGAAPSRGARRLIERLLWSTAGAMVAAHGDPRPAVDPRASSRQ